MGVHLHAHLPLSRAPELVGSREPETIITVRRERLPLSKHAVLDGSSRGLDRRPFVCRRALAFGNLDRVLIEILIKGCASYVNSGLYVISFPMGTSIST